MSKKSPTISTYDKGSFSIPNLPTWKEDEDWYYKVKAPSDGETPLTMLRYFMFRNKDDTYGRKKIPQSPAEVRLRKNENIIFEQYFYNCPYNGKISYRVILDKTKQDKLKHPSDYMLLHGFTSSAIRWFPSIQPFLDAGYRVILPDLPAHGHSSGIHADVPHVEKIPDTMLGVVAELHEYDSKNNKPKRRIYVGGESMGGFTAAYMSVKSSMDSSFPHIDGATLVCPMFELSPQSYPGKFLVGLAKFLSNKVGTMMIDGNIRNQGFNTKEPSEEFAKDPSTYHGRVRIRTAAGCFIAMEELAPLYNRMKVPFVIVHGLGDHVTNPQASLRFFEEADTNDKELVYLKDVEHMILRVGRNEEEDEQRQTCLKIMLDFLKVHDEK